MRPHGELVTVGVEGTGADGADPTRVLNAAGDTVVDADRTRSHNAADEKQFDVLDAHAAAAAVLSGRATHAEEPGRRVEAVRVLRIARRSAVKARAQSTNRTP
ncbi:hypothetical protein [Streptomyces sp. NPDC059176]|uniref:hypothetical protein n=1 Tax=unclassified Streptomyces TaxID=2593676 RepID=UPI0036B83A4E